MTNSRDVALKVLGRVEKDGAFAAAALTKELTSVKASREAAFATELVLGVLRRRSLLDHLLEAKSSRGLSQLSPLVRNILRIGAYQIVFLDRVPSRAAVSEAVNQTRNRGAMKFIGLVNALLRNLAGEEPFDPAAFDRDDGATIKDASVRIGLPQWILERLVASLGREGAFETARAFNLPSRRTLRVNLNRIRREDILAQLEPFAAPGDLSPWSVDIQNPKKAASLFEEGLAVYQDEGSQLAALAVTPNPGDRILDACAGRGGKTAALAMMTSGQASIVAADRKQNKLDRLEFELTRQGLVATTMAVDLLGDTTSLGNGYDRILLDAPCSGTGTLGRRPEIRWRIDPAAVSSLLKVQAAMLQNTAPLLTSGGLLVYTVCSVLEEEGTAQVERFLHGHPDFHYAKTPPLGWPDAVSWNQGKARLDPGAHGTDGFQIISLERE